MGSLEVFVKDHIFEERQSWKRCRKFNTLKSSHLLSCFANSFRKEQRGSSSDSSLKLLRCCSVWFLICCRADAWDTEWVRALAEIEYIRTWSCEIKKEVQKSIYWMVAWSLSFMSDNSNTIAEENRISDCWRLAMSGCWRLPPSCMPNQREGHWSDAWLIALAKVPCPSTWPDSPISAWHLMKSFLLTCCLGVQAHASLQIWCGDVLLGYS